MATSKFIQDLGDGAPTGNQLLNTLIGVNRWDQAAGEPVTIAYSFMQGEEPSASFFYGIDWIEEEMAGVRAAMDAWAAVANVKFVEEKDAAKSSLWLWLELTMGDAYGAMNPPDQNYNSQVYVKFNPDRNLSPWGNASVQPGGFSFAVFLHELGHALGLDHPHMDDESTDPTKVPFPGVTAPYDSLGDNNLNQHINTVMSYNAGLDGVWPVHLGGGAGWTKSPMALDIAAIQRMHGANMETATGDDTYVLPATNDDGTGWSCIWDAGGTDTIAAGDTDLTTTIDLREAPLVGADAGGYLSFTDEIWGGMTIANAVTIENAIGGRGDDVITGNGAANVISGLGGDDLITGGAGNDRISGGNGSDSASGDEGSDTISGDGGNDLLTGGAGNDVISGGTGGDSAAGGTGSDTLHGEDGNDTLSGDDGKDTLNGNAGSDELRGGAGDDTLNGADGNDTMSGDDGIDVLNGGTGDDDLSGGTAADMLSGLLGADILSGGDGNDILSGGMGVDTLNGDAGADTLLGGFDNDTLFGGAGNDTLSGSFGNDVMNGGAGADRFLFSEAAGRANADTIAGFNAAEDKIVLSNMFFSKLAGGALDEKSLHVGTEAQNAKDFIIFDHDTGNLWYDADGRQPAIAQQLICTLEVGSFTGTLTAGNFEII